jgi:hypothetical protein
MNDYADIATMEKTPDVENNQMELLAKLACQRLTDAYPAHLWAVGWLPGGALCVKNMAIEGNWGYTVDCVRAATISEIEKAVVLGGGELLERAGVRRGQWNGEFMQIKDKS